MLNNKSVIKPAPQTYRSSTNSPPMVKGQKFEIGSKYANLTYLGEGAYGIVVSAVDTSDKDTNVAIKKITPFEHQLMSQRTYREIYILTRFKHDNIISILDIVRASTIETMNDVYLVFEKMDTDLHRILRTQKLTDEHVTLLVYQLLRGLKYIHSANVIHRDLKPSNILVNANCDLKICDFGLARIMDPSRDHSGFLTEYVATRWYRAPEVLLINDGYTKAMDVWSVGCILGEMFDNKPMFPGKDYMNQMKVILDIIGSPTDADLQYLKNDRMIRYVRLLPARSPIKWSVLYPKASRNSLDLLNKMLTFNPNDRISADQALQHAYVMQYHDPSEEPVFTEPFHFESELDDWKTDELKRKIFEETVRFSRR